MEDLLLLLGRLHHAHVSPDARVLDKLESTDYGKASSSLIESNQMLACFKRSYRFRKVTMVALAQTRNTNNRSSCYLPQYYSCDHLFQNKCKMLLSWSPPFKNRNTGLVYICFSNWGVILTLPAQSKKAFFTPEGHHPGPGPSWMWIASLATTEVYGYWVLSWCARMSLSCLEVLLSVKYTAILF